MATHSPGPWSFAHKLRAKLPSDPSNDGIFIRQSPNGSWVAKVHRRNGTDAEPDTEAYANAALIAAAPEMLAALKSADDLITVAACGRKLTGISASVHNAIRAAIAKATGK